MPDPETSFRIAILGDFSGRENRKLNAPLGNRKFLLVDRDNFDEILAKLRVAVHLPILGKTTPPIRVRFSELDDFHPDHLFEKVEVFDALKETRQGLKDLSTSEAIGKKAPAIPVAPKGTERPLQGTLDEKAGGLLDQVLEQTQREPSRPGPSRESSEWDNFLREIVRPHVVPDAHQEQAEAQALVDAATCELMRRILHHPDFQAIEAAWRGLCFLVSRLETDEQLKLYLLDVSKEELAADLFASDSLKSTGIYKLLVEESVETPGGEPWAVLAGNYTFDKTLKDAELLGRMAKISKEAGAPFIAAAHPHLLGCDSLVETPDPDDWKGSAGKQISRAWKALRKLPEASYLGLVIPRFLLRLPYGKNTEPTELFRFEEMENAPKHDQYLWGNPAFACVSLLANAFSQYGWDFRPGMILDIEDLPVHVCKEEGESRMKPCSEFVLTERAAEAILVKGLIPLLSFRNQDRVRLARFQSLADPSTILAMRWRSGGE